MDLALNYQKFDTIWIAYDADGHPLVKLPLDQDTDPYASDQEREVSLLMALIHVIQAKATQWGTVLNRIRPCEPETEPKLVIPERAIRATLNTMAYQGEIESVSLEEAALAFRSKARAIRKCCDRGELPYFVGHEAEYRILMEDLPEDGRVRVLKARKT